MQSTTATCTCAYANLSIVAQLSGDPKQSESLAVYVLREKSAWRGELSTTSVSDAVHKTDERLGSNCAATRGKNGASRAFRLLQFLGSSNDNSRVVLSDDATKLRVETNWGTEYGVKGLFLPVIGISLVSIGTPVFYKALFVACSASRSQERHLSDKEKYLKEDVEDLRRTNEDLLETAVPLQRKALSRAMAGCLNAFKKTQQQEGDYLKA